MKKTFTLIMLSMITLGVSAQGWELPATFETTGEDTCWGVFANDPNDPPTIVSNPANTGLNTSDYCLKVDITENSTQWVGAWSIDYGPWHASADTQYFEVMVYSAVPRVMSIRGNYPLDPEQGQYGYMSADTMTKSNEWELLTFHFPEETWGIAYNQIQIFFDRGVEAQGESLLWDNLNLVSIPTKVQQKHHSEILRIFPNPASEFLVVDYPQMHKISISNLIGQQVMSMEFLPSSQKTLELSSIDPGIYFVTIDTEKGTLSRKFIKR